MTWTRLSDDFADREEIASLSDAAWRTHVEAYIWSNGQTTDGRIPRNPRLLARILPGATEDVLAELTESSVWLVEEDHYRLDWTDQLDADEVDANRDKWARQKKRQRMHGKGDHTLCDPQRCWYLIAHPDVVSRVDSTADSTRDSKADSTVESRGVSRGSRSRPAPVPLPSRREEGEGRGGEKASPVEVSAPGMALTGQPETETSPDRSAFEDYQRYRNARVALYEIDVDGGEHHIYGPDDDVSDDDEVGDGDA